MPEVLLRRAGAADALDMAEIQLRCFAVALPTVRRAHDDDEVRTWFARVVVPQREAWVAVADDAVIGLMVLGDTEVEQLYLDPTWRGRGVGAKLLTLAKQRRPGGLQLWTFQVNQPAQRFYLRHGFVEVRRTDGHANEEREPDIRYVWSPVS